MRLSALSSLLSISFSSSAYVTPVLVTCSSLCIRGIASHLAVSPVVVQSEVEKLQIIEKIARTVDGGFYLRILSSQPGGGVRSSGTPRDCQLIQAKLPSNAYPRLPESSESRRQFDFIRAELPSNGHPQPSGSPPASALFKPLRRIWADWMHPPGTASTHYGFRSRQGSSPARHVPLLCLSLFPPLVSRSWDLYV